MPDCASARVLESEFLSKTSHPYDTTFISETPLERIRIENKKWRNISFENFCLIFEKLEKKNSNYFKLLKKKYLFEHNNSSYIFFNFIEDNINFYQYNSKLIYNNTETNTLNNPYLVKLNGKNTNFINSYVNNDTNITKKKK